MTSEDRFLTIGDLFYKKFNVVPENLQRSYQEVRMSKQDINRKLADYLFCDEDDSRMDVYRAIIAAEYYESNRFTLKKSVEAKIRAFVATHCSAVAEHLTEEVAQQLVYTYLQLQNTPLPPSTEQILAYRAIGRLKNIQVEEQLLLQLTFLCIDVEGFKSALLGWLHCCREGMSPFITTLAMQIVVAILQCTESTYTPQSVFKPVSLTKYRKKYIPPNFHEILPGDALEQLRDSIKQTFSFSLLCEYILDQLTARGPQGPSVISSHRFDPLILPDIRPNFALKHLMMCFNEKLVGMNARYFLEGNAVQFNIVELTNFIILYADHLSIKPWFELPCNISFCQAAAGYLFDLNKEAADQFNRNNFVTGAGNQQNPASEAPMSSIAYYMIMASLGSQDQPQTSHFVLPAQSVVEFCRKAELNHRQLVECLQLNESPFFRVVDIASVRPLKNQLVKSAERSDLLAFCAVLTSMYQLQPLLLYPAAVAVLSYQTEEYYWLLVHRVPVSVFFVKEKGFRRTVKQALTLYYKQLLQRLTDEYSMVKQVALLHYLHVCDANQYESQFKAAYEAMSANVNTIKYLPSERPNINDYDVFKLMVAQKYYSHDYNALKSMQLIVALGETKQGMGQLINVFNRSLMGSSVDIQQQFFQQLQTLQESFCRRQLQTIQDNPVVKYISSIAHDVIELEQIDYRMFQLVMYQVVCQQNDYNAVVNCYNALQPNMRNYVLVQALLNARSTKFDHKRLKKLALKEEILAHHLYQVRFDLDRKEEWDVFENMQNLEEGARDDVQASSILRRLQDLWQGPVRDGA